MNNSTEQLPEVQTLVDTISNFPDDILCHILSSINTKEAVATSILSKRWKFLWTYVDTLDIEEIYMSTLEFEEYVNTAMQLHRGLIKRMRLVCYKRECNKHDIDEWIQTAISKKVETLHLCFHRYLKWPLCLCHCQTLVELRLVCADISNTSIPNAPLFPKLKKLHLIKTDCKTDFLNLFISGCPILEYLKLDFYRFSGNDSLHVETYYISSATLKTFSLYDSTTYLDNKAMIVLNTPALEVLETRNNRNLELRVESSMPSLHKAKIPIRLSHSDSSLRCLECLSNVSVLRCEAPLFWQIFPQTMNLHARFNNLTRLKIVGRQFGLDLLRFFMQTSNNLKAITLVKKTSCWVYKEIGVMWEEPQHVPKCMSLLQSVSIYGYHLMGTHQNVEEMIKYILANAKVLKQLQICESYLDRTDHEFQLDILNEISMFPKASELCEILIN